ncbi:hypothetical protein XELAEV_18018311mg [Xenopus laevis]|uniref:Uncharacterized protein n=1 Tax=Xenopus laevis TaxID=8355 RepID=A0A974DD85_XENLA|nr:hypothetical protein XELAEV_18018311mg [Xenopus laevis]
MAFIVVALYFSNVLSFKKLELAVGTRFLNLLFSNKCNVTETLCNQQTNLYMECLDFSGGRFTKRAKWLTLASFCHLSARTSPIY